MSWPMYRHVERQAVRMNEMMNRLGVDPVKVARHNAGQSYCEARTRCLQCADAQACLCWLEATGEAVEPPGFCPNVALFAVCRRDMH